jgi:DNA-binding NarL/FixJ family response regulator
MTLPSANGHSRKIRVVVADDHDVLRKALLQLLAAESDVEVVGEATDGQEAVELALQTRPDVVLMDVSMPHCNGVEATRGMRAELPGVRVVGLSMFAGEGMASLMIQAGAAAYLPKEAPFEQVIAAIRGEPGPPETWPLQ